MKIDVLQRVLIGSCIAGFGRSNDRVQRRSLTTNRRRLPRDDDDGRTANGRELDLAQRPGDVAIHICLERWSRRRVTTRAHQTHTRGQDQGQDQSSRAANQRQRRVAPRPPENHAICHAMVPATLQMYRLKYIISVTKPVRSRFHSRHPINSVPSKIQVYQDVLSMRRPRRTNTTQLHIVTILAKLTKTNKADKQPRLKQLKPPIEGASGDGGPT